MEELDENVPAAQLLHVEIEAAPVALENLPAVHPSHVPAPAAENVPAAHSLHVEIEPAPVVLENLPAVHITQEALVDSTRLG